VINVTGKVEANADKIAHVSPRISGKIVAVRTSLGDSVSAGQSLATLDSVELGEAQGRYHQSKTKLALAQSNMDRIKGLVDKKIAARKDILLAETDFKTAQTELHTDEERLTLYGVAVADLKGDTTKNRSCRFAHPSAAPSLKSTPLSGELSDPSKSLYTVADLSSVWVLVDINEKDLAKVRRVRRRLLPSALSRTRNSRAVSPISPIWLTNPPVRSRRGSKLPIRVGS